MPRRGLGPGLAAAGTVAHPAPFEFHIHTPYRLLKEKRAYNITRHLAKFIICKLKIVKFSIIYIVKSR